MRSDLSRRLERLTAQPSSAEGETIFIKRGEIASTAREIAAAAKRILGPNPLARRTRKQRGLKD